MAHLARNRLDSRHCSLDWRIIFQLKGQADRTIWCGDDPGRDRPRGWICRRVQKSCRHCRNSALLQLHRKITSVLLGLEHVQLSRLQGRLQNSKAAPLTALANELQSWLHRCDQASRWCLVGMSVIYPIINWSLTHSRSHCKLAFS